MAALGLSANTSLGKPSENDMDIAALIRLKERELHEIHDLRSGQLEKLIEERDGQIKDHLSRFEQLKDDFVYNLTLLEARDKELERLEKAFEATSQELATSESERRSLTNKLDLLELRDTERATKYENEKANSKRALTDLRDAIESMRWAAGEEAKTKQREIEVLRSDAKFLAAARDDALEAQRRDLTQTFEALLAQRESSFSERESKIGEQVRALDERHELLATESCKLRNQLQEQQRAAELAQDALSAEQNKSRQLQWRLDDERQRWREEQDELERKLTSSSREIEVQQEAHIISKQESDHEIRRMKAELARITDLNASQEKYLTEKAGASENSNREARVEILQLESAQDSLRNEISRLNRSWEVANARCAALEKEKEAYLRALEEQSVERRQLESLNAKADAQKQVLCENEKLLQEKIEELSEHKTQQEARITKLDTELQQALKDVSEKQQEISKLQDAIASEKEAQVQLRTQLSNAATLTAANVAALDARYSIPPSSTSANRLKVSTRLSNEGMGVLAENPASPLFSDDFGDVSLPGLDSPLATPYARTSGQGVQPLKALQSENKDFPASTTTSAATIELERENERLRQAVQNMRKDMESLQEQVLNASAEGKVVSEHDEGNAARLEQMTKEVVRLRAERRTLMDMGNELRAALFRCGGELPKNLPPPPPQQQQQQQEQAARVHFLPTQGEDAEDSPSEGNYPPRGRGQRRGNGSDTHSVLNATGPGAELGAELVLSSRQLDNLGVVGEGQSRSSAVRGRLSTGRSGRPSRVGAAAGGGKGGAQAAQSLVDKAGQNRKVLNYAIGLREAQETREKQMIIPRPGKPEGAAEKQPQP